MCYLLYSSILQTNLVYTNHIMSSLTSIDIMYNLMVQLDYDLFQMIPAIKLRYSIEKATHSHRFADWFVIDAFIWVGNGNDIGGIGCRPGAFENAWITNGIRTFHKSIFAVWFININIKEHLRKLFDIVASLIPLFRLKSERISEAST